MSTNMERYGTLWTLADVRYLKRCYFNVPIEKIAQHLQRTPKAIREKASKLGLYPPTNRFKNNILGHIRQALSHRNMSRGQLSKQLGVGFSSLFKPLRYLLDTGVVRSYKR